MASISLYEFMEDFDNSELSEYERREQLENAVADYNEENGTSYNPAKSFLNYESWRKEKYTEL